ncbi:hypothetical protein HP532_25125 [Pseudomonas sp. CrR25]|nr:hypothetical protein [Pseudomonas sp. CrR25]
MSDKTATPPGPSASPRRLGGALLGLLHGHIALFGEELKEQQTHALRLFLLSGLCLLFGLLLLLGLSAALLVAFWESHRLSVIAGLCAFYALGLALCLAALLLRLRNAPDPFAASLEELAHDREQLLP